MTEIPQQSHQSSVKCEVCGGELRSFTNKTNAGLVCEACGWSIIRSNISAMDLDNTVYRLSLFAPEISLKLIKNFAILAECNWIEAKKKLLSAEDRPVFVCSGDARKIAAAKVSLSDAGAEVSIKPVWRYR
jgi:hypothetical protein